MPPNDAPCYFLGIGLSEGAVAADARSLAEDAIAGAGLPHDGLEAIATISSRRDNPVVLALAGHFACGVRYFDAAVLEAETPRLRHPSQSLFERIGCHGVAEAAALAAAGHAAHLVVEKTTGRRLTVAIALRSAKF